MKYLLIAISIFNFGLTLGYSQNTENIFLVTLDGLRWQEVFNGAADSMVYHKELTRETEQIEKDYLDKETRVARQKLMPFLWTTVAKDGVLLGNRNKGSEMSCTNRFWFSYPGYNEILTGVSDPRIDSNKKINNPNTTILEWLQLKPKFKKKVAAFCSWDVFEYIINKERSGIPVNNGFDLAKHGKLTNKEKFLNELQTQIPSPWSNVRLDAFTYHYAMEYLRQYTPKVVFISFGETDDFAHDGRYDHYLNAAHNTDKFIAQLWAFIQSHPAYKNKSTLIITTDHGRGHSPMDEWKNHGNLYKGSNEIWMAAIGNGIPALGELNTTYKVYQNQIAATIGKLLGYDYHSQNDDIGRPIDLIFKNQNKK
jgi:hypothetical protein